MLDLKKIKADGVWFEPGVLYERYGVRLKLRPITKGELDKIFNECTSYTFDKKTHQRIKVIDEEKRDKLFEQKTVDLIVDWEGVFEGEEKLEPTTENKRKFLNIFGTMVITKKVEGEEEKQVTLLEAIIDFAKDLENFIDKEGEENF